jgi:hypothetical protein
MLFVVKANPGLFPLHEALMTAESVTFLVSKTRNEAWPVRGDSAQRKSRLISSVPRVPRENKVDNVLKREVLLIKTSSFFKKNQ